MMELFRSLDVQELQASLEAWFHTHVLVSDNLIQAGQIVLALLIGLTLGRRLKRLITGLSGRWPSRADVQAFAARLATLSAPIVMLVLLWIAVEVGMQTDLFGYHLTRTVATLISAWVVIHLAAGLIKNDALARFVAWTAWILAALIVLGLYDAAIALLDGMAVSFGEVRISVLAVMKGALLLGLILWVAVPVSKVLERSIGQMVTLTPSAQVLTSKFIKIALITLAFLIVISSLGVDLTALAVFGGALGIGIGFGLQKVMSNLVSGLLLLIDKSIKPGDVITVGGTYGWVESLGARYTAVRTRDGIEHLIPNEELIAQRVENWSHSDKAVRLGIPVGVSYKADVRLAIRLCVQAANAVERVLATPEPRCFLREFGDNSVNLEIRIWIDDPPQGRANVASEVLLGVWDLFHEHGIEIPFPQRDLHLKSSEIPWPTGGGEVR